MAGSIPQLQQHRISPLHGVRTEEYREVQRGTDKYRGVQTSTERYTEMQKSKEKYRQVKRSTV